MENRIAKTYKFREAIVSMIDKLAKIPEYGNRTHLIEVLVWREAEQRGIVRPENGKNDPRNAKKLTHRSKLVRES
jgi:hypothetical protein